MRGFATALLLLPLATLLHHTAAVHGEVWAGAQAIEAALATQQAVAEAVYEVEDGFALAVRAGLAGLTGGESPAAAAGRVCAAIEAWAQRLGGQLAVGHVRPPSYGLVGGLPLDACPAFLEVDAPARRARVAGPGLPGAYAVFHFSNGASYGSLAVLIPEGTVVEG